MLVNTRAIVISALKYAEADLIVRCFTQTSGLKSYLLRGVLKSRKGKFKASMFQPLTQLELVAKHKDKGKLEYLQDARLLLHYQSLHTNVVKSTMVLFLSEVLRSAIQEEEQNEPLYVYLEGAVNYLDQTENISNFHLLFLLELTRYLGFYPDDSLEGGSCFNLLDGIFQEEKTNEYCIDGPNFVLLKQLLGTNFDDLEHIKLTRSARANFLTMLLAYYRLHIESFRNPQSLTVLNEIFN
ncbi:DNA repair protein RecO [Antarcticibacterium flavum]|uniref:DNA repair protein RecO n=1 Tax=Antarcticibacterium flavum TaxID=2058175 RepID=A0A5B7X1R8_9FLAO|nr:MULTISPECIES: DNA repair protein RecO [Antarcticibacterium]MCM4159102.1 DNA repair protein RecO [Antarcticibacterium sp. W02-3]QCY69504.1 DNA repair protein RecO [Antarcticibacterium flavum]